MKIAVDARELTGRPTGVGRYLSELLVRWAASPDARRHDWRVYAHDRVLVPPDLGAASVVIDGGGGTSWEQWALPRRLAVDRPDVLFAPGYSGPITTPCPVAVTIHDVSFAAHPEWFSLREGIRRRWLTGWSARRARVVITDSAFSREEIVRCLGIPAPRIRVIPLGLTPPVEDVTPTGARQEPLALFVGSIFRRRHVDRLIEAFVHTVGPRVEGSRLEIVGENRTHPALDLTAILRGAPPDLARRVSIRSYVDEATLRSLYARATVFAFPSEYEGFGLTPLEALAAGVPPVVLDTPVAREIYGHAARYVSRDLADGAALGDAIAELMVDPGARAAILRDANAVLGRYDWRRTAEDTLRAIEEAAGV